MSIKKQLNVEANLMNGNNWKLPQNKFNYSVSRSITSKINDEQTNKPEKLLTTSKIRLATRKDR